MVLYFKALSFKCFKVLTEGQRLKEGGNYFEVREIIHVRFQKFVSFSFKITLEVYHNDIKPYIFQISSYFNYLIVCLFVPYD